MEEFYFDIALVDILNTITMAVIAIMKSFLNLSLADILNAIAMIVIAIFTVLLWRVGSQQNKYTRVLQRAYLAVEPLGIHPFDKDGWVHISVRNKGKLPAQNVTWFIDHTISDNGKLKEFPINESRFYGERLTVPVETEMKRSHRYNLEEQRIHSFLVASDKQRVFFYIWGEIRYSDGFENQRFTRFCHRYDNFGVRIISEGKFRDKNEIPAGYMRLHQFGNEAD